MVTTATLGRLALALAMVLAAALLTERLTTVFVAGFGAVVLRVLLVNWPRRAVGGPH